MQNVTNIHLLVQPVAVTEMLHYHLGNSIGSTGGVWLKCDKY